MPSPIEFPFARGKEYRLDELRSFEQVLAAYRKNDREFSSNLRLNKFDWAKLRNDELVPFKLFVDFFALSGERVFEIAKEGHAEFDLMLTDVHGSPITVQITVADPEWNGNGGRNQALENMLLARDEVVWGAGGTHKAGHHGSVTSRPNSVSSEQRLEACTSAILMALSRKCRAPNSADCLIIYARNHAFELIDDGFECVALPIIDNARNQHAGSTYGAIYVVDCLGHQPRCAGSSAQDFVALLGSGR